MDFTWQSPDADFKEQVLTLGGAPYLLTMPPAGILEMLFWTDAMSEVKEPYFSCECKKKDGTLMLRQVTYLGSRKSVTTATGKKGTPEYDNILAQDKISRFYFAMLPLNENGDPDSILRMNYNDGEQVDLGVFASKHSPMAAPHHTALSGDALARLVPTKWDREQYTICDPEDTQIKKEPELISWIHFNGILISKYPYFQSCIRDCLYWKYLPVREELYHAWD